MVRQVHEQVSMRTLMSTPWFELVNAQTAWRVVVGMILVAGRWFAGRVVPRGRRPGAGPGTI